MGRGAGDKSTKNTAVRRAKKNLKAMDLNQIFEKFSEEDPNEPDWRVPNDLYIEEAEQLRRDVVLDYLKDMDGVGENLAVAIIQQLGIHRLEEIDKDPSILKKVHLAGVSPQTLEDLADNWHEKREEYPAFQMDRVVAKKLLDLPLDALSHDAKNFFLAHKRWYKGALSQLIHPKDTVPGMMEAASSLLESIENGDKIAVFCDYDVDGTSAGEVLRRGVEPYGAKLHYGWADAETGFGLTEDFVRDAAKKGCKVLITLDCGSGQTEETELAQSLGMKVIVVDHHDVADNPADFHLNPKLQEPLSSDNTGAQLAWKLGSAVQIEKEGLVRDDYKNESLYLAGMGCMADMGSSLLPENRSFIWGAHDQAPLGIRALARELDENPDIPGHLITTQACLNLPKRTARVSAADVGKLLAAKTDKDAAPIVKKLIKEYKSAKEERQKMTADAVGAVGQAQWNDDGSVDRPEPEKFVAHYIIEKTDYPGYTGPVASRVSASARKPAVVFAAKGEDEFGQKIYKFSSRSEGGVRSEHNLGQLLEDEKMREACTVKSRDHHGEVITKPSLGGHEQVVSGACTKEHIPAVLEAMETWARSKGRNGSRFFSGPWTGADAYLVERKVHPERLTSLEKQASRLGPYTRREQLVAPRRKDMPVKTARHSQPEISIYGTLDKLSPDPDSPGWLQGELTLTNGEKREVRYPEDVDDCPKGEVVEWILKLGTSGPYYLRKFARTKS